MVQHPPNPLLISPLFLTKERKIHWKKKIQDLMIEIKKSKKQSKNP